ncbi:G-protein coupled receptor moody-like [Clytia hemisphaerica]|uniref:G-protein coupled receptors family 1 profile domain-containing protein n=1 Tax=Clytia hemisphaerica TaxID=252671 RepID=A0A7M5V4E2_9CNID
MKNGTSYTDYPEFKFARTVNLCFPPVIVLIGCVGNLLSFFIYIKRKYKDKVAPVYILSLSIIDSINLVIGLLQYWLMFNFYPEDITPLHCHVMFFLVNAMANHSHWVVIAFTFDRFLAVWFPFWTRQYQNRHRAWMTVIIIGLISYAKNLHYIWTAEFIYQPKTKVASCGFGIRDKNQWVLDYQLFEIAVSSLVPFIIIVVLNSSIVYRMHKDGNFSKAQRRHQGHKLKSQFVTSRNCKLQTSQQRQENNKSENHSIPTFDTKPETDCATANSYNPLNNTHPTIPKLANQEPDYNPQKDKDQNSKPKPHLTIPTSSKRRQTIVPSDSIQQITSELSENIKPKRLFHYGLTISLLLVSSAFVVLVSPLLVLRFYYMNQEHITPHHKAVYTMKYQICQKLWYSNNAVNFFLYSLSGRSFRSDLKATILGLYTRMFPKGKTDRRSNSRTTLDSVLRFSDSSTTTDTANSVKENNT